MSDFKSIDELVQKLTSEFEAIGLLGVWYPKQDAINWVLQQNESWKNEEIGSFIKQSLIPGNGQKAYLTLEKGGYLLLQELKEGAWIIVGTTINIYPQLNMFLRGVAIENFEFTPTGPPQQVKTINETAKKDPFVEKLYAAKRLQSTLLPKHERMDVIFNKYWVHYAPQDIIGGDLYWVKEFEDVNYLIIADCTGHSVEGALATMTVYSIMNECLDPDTSLKENLNTFFNKINQYNDAEDAYGIGVEVALVRIHKNESRISFISTGIFVMTQLKADWELHKVRKSLDPTAGPTDKALLIEDIAYEKGDKIVLFSDGLPDQFDKTNKKRLGSRGMKELIIDIGQNGTFNQEGLQQKINDWQGATEQVDDITVFALEF